MYCAKGNKCTSSKVQAKQREREDANRILKCEKATWAITRDRVCGDATVLATVCRFRCALRSREKVSK